MSLLNLKTAMMLAIILCLHTAVRAEQEINTTVLSKVDITPLPERKIVQDFIADMLKKHAYSKEELMEIFSKTEVKPKIIDLITKPYETKPWYIYQTTFLSDKKVQDGVAFWKANEQALTKAENKFGVPASIIVAIIGVETNYGKLKGNYRVIDALSTLAFDYPPRAKFFTQELEAYLLLCKEQGFAPLQFTGSYAGAMGYPQFMPSSWRSYAIDFSHSGNNDIVNNVTNAIGSVANYFKQHGWKHNEMIAIKTSVTGTKYKEFLSPGKEPKPKYTVQELTNAKVAIDNKLKTYHDKLALLGFDDGDKEHAEYWLGFNNFYVISRYNHSTNYSMAIYQLSERLQAAFAQEAQAK